MWDWSFKIWRVFDFKCLEFIEKVYDDVINVIVVFRDGFCYMGLGDKMIKVWRKKDKSYFLVVILKKYFLVVNVLVVSEDGKVFYLGVCDRLIFVWERLSNGDGDDDELYMIVVGVLRGYMKVIMCLVVVFDLVLSGLVDKSLRVWRRGLLEKDGYFCLVVLEGYIKFVKCLVVLVFGFGLDFNFDYFCMVYSGSFDFFVKVWNLRVLIV